MKVTRDSGEVIDLGTLETAPTIGITDYSRRETDDYGVTTVVERGFAPRMSVRLGVPFDAVDALQLKLADLRAEAALWVADERYASLSIRGFYKDFSLDLAGTSLSYCTLTVEGLTSLGTLVDAGGDPAPDGHSSTLQLLQPITVTDAVLTSSSVGETDYAAWSSSTSYPLGARVIKTATHRIYESAAAANLGNDPAGTSGKWFDIAPTNRWAMFDQALGTATSHADSIAVTLTPAAAVNGLALIDVVGAAVRVQAPGYDQLQPVTAGKAVVFLNLVAAAGSAITVTISAGTFAPRIWDDSGTWADASTWADTVFTSGTGPVAVGTLLLGSVLGLGITEVSPTAAITDYSRKDTDEFGAVTVVERAWAKRMTANALLSTTLIDTVAARIAAVRAKPSLWIGQTGVDSLTVYGFFKDFSIEVGETVSKLSLSIEGLSKAAPLAATAGVLVPRGVFDVATSYGNGDLVQHDGSSWLYIATEASTGHTPPALPATEDAWWRVIAAAGANGTNGANGTPGAAGANGANGTNGINGTNGAPGAPGANGQTTYVHVAYANSPDGSADFTSGAPGSRTYIGVRTDFTATDSETYSDYTWSKLTGDNGLNGANGTAGANGYVHFAYANAVDGSVDFHVSDPTGRRYIGVYSDFTLADSTSPGAYTWSLVKGADGAAGANGANGADAISVNLSTYSLIVQADSSNVTKAGQLPRSATLKVLQGTTDITSSCTVALTPSTTSITASYSAPTVSITAADASGYIDVQVTYGGSVIGTPRIQIARPQDAPPPASQSSDGKDLSFTVSSGSYAGPSSGTIILKANASGQLILSGGGEYYAQGATLASGVNFRMAACFAWRPAAGGSWSYTTDTAGSQATTPKTSLPDDPTLGSFSIGSTLTGLTAGASYEVGVAGRKYSGTGSSALMQDGSFTVAQ